MRINFAVGNESVRDKAASSSLLVNMYAEPLAEGSKSRFSLYHTPGNDIWVDLAVDEPVWGMHVLNNTLYVVCGSNVFTVDALGNKNNIGNIGLSYGRVFMEDNRVQVAILKQTGELFTTDGATVSQVTDPDYMPASAMTFSDGYGVFSKAQSDVWFISDLLDFRAYDALDFATASEKSDILVRPYAFNNGLWLFGQESIEVWSNTGNQLFPFEQIPGAVKTSRGCAAAFSLAQEDNTLFWLGNDGIVWKAEGFDPKKVSNFSTDYIISQMSVISDAFGFVYTEAGHKFYVLTFPTEQVSLALDLNTQQWHIRRSFEQGRWLANCFVAFAGMNLIGDYRTGKLYALSSETYTENGDIIERIFRTQPLWSDTGRDIIDSLTLDIDCGVGLTSGQGSDPIVFRRFSDDGGRTWSNDSFGYFGKIGEYYRRVIWRQEGQYRQRIYEFVITDPVPCLASGLYAEIRKGRV